VRISPHQWIALKLYRALFTVGVILFVIVFPLWLFNSKRRNTLFPRLGWQQYPRVGPSIRNAVWIHAVSIGELLSAGGLIESLRRHIGDRPLYLSVSTISAFALATERFGRLCDGCFYFPYDVPFAVNRCLETIRPALVVFIETDIWPGFLADLRNKAIPCLLVNGRLSPESFRTYRAIPALFEPAFNTFRSIYPQSPGEAERFLAIGVEEGRLRSAGNLKFDAALATPEDGQIADLRGQFRLPAGAPVLIAGSTHPGEEEIIRSCFLRLRSTFPDLRLILVPRRPERGIDVAGLFQRDGIDASLFSQLNRSVPVIVVDRLGYLSRLYALADIAIIGGSFVPKGGQNPIEPAACGKPVLFGSDMHDFPDVSAWLLEAGGAVRARNEEELYAACDRLLTHPEQAVTMGKQGRHVVTAHQGTTTRIVQDIVSILGPDEQSKESGHN
jgi:3-deoxy-D-manno-octulosonic-acid transferase